MQQRYYDPLAARFMSLDPVTTDANTGGMFNRYVYGNNNPYRFTDPDGRVPIGSCGWASSQCESVGEAGRSSNTVRATTVTAGAFLGGTLAGAAATGCAVGTGGICGLGGPAIVGIGIAGGAAAGNLVVDAFDWVRSVISSAMSSTGADSDKKPAADDRGSRRPSKEVKDAADAAARDQNGNLNCQYCGQGLTEQPGHGNSREFDHYNPWARGGGSRKDNVVDACRDCNRGPGGKGSKLFPDEWIPPPRP